MTTRTSDHPQRAWGLLPLVVAFVLVTLLGVIPAPVAEAAAPELPWLKVSGNRIVTASTGQDVILRGANVLRSEWDMKMDAERRGMPALASWKGNVLVRGFASDPVNAANSRYLDMLDEHVTLAATHGMYVVFAWRSHTINGPQPTMPDDRAQRALATLAKRYSTKPNVMYALQVEPHDVNWSQVQPRFVQMVDAIRTAARPNKPIVMVPGVDWSRDLSGALDVPVNRENIVYKTHPYNSASKFQQQFLNTYDAGKAVFIGEFGYLPEHDMHMSDVQALMGTARTRGLGWVAWAFDFQGGPNLVTDNTAWAPTYPYGTAVKTAMASTPAVPRDAAAPPASRTAGPTPVNINDTAFRYSGIWRAAYGRGTYRSDERSSTTKGSSFSVPFTGVQARLFATTSPRHGKAAISIDGGQETVVDLYSAKTVQQELVHQTPRLANGRHVLRVRVTGTMNAGSRGTTVTADRADITTVAI